MAVDRPSSGEQGQDAETERGDKPVPSAADRINETRAELDTPGQGPREWRDPRDMLSPEDRAHSYSRLHKPLTEAELTELEAKNIEHHGVPYGWDDGWDDPADIEDRADTDVPADNAGTGDAEDLRSDRESAESIDVPERADRPHAGAELKVVADYYPLSPRADERYFVRDQANLLPALDGTPTREQTAQGQIGDCGVVSTLGAVAGHRPQTIENAITQTGEGRYDVRLHEVDPATPRDPVARPTGDTITYKITDVIPVVIDRPERRPLGIQADTCGWPALMEKGVATQDQTWDAKQQADWNQTWLANKPTVDAERRAHGLSPSPTTPPTGYNRLDIGSTPYDRANLLAEITGEEAKVRTLPNEQQGEQALLNELRDRLADNKPILVGTRPQLRGETEPVSRRVFAFSHAYEVVKVENDMIHLRNPWGLNEWGQPRDPPPMDARAFWEYCRQYNSDGSRTGHYSTLK